MLHSITFSEVTWSYMGSAFFKAYPTPSQNILSSFMWMLSLPFLNVMLFLFYSLDSLPSKKASFSFLLRISQSQSLNMGVYPHQKGT